MSDEKVFPHPTNTWIEEEIEVPTFDAHINEKENRVEITRGTKKATRKTFYAQSTPKRNVCAHHEYFPVNIHTYEFKCIHCDWSRIAYPVTYKYDPETKQLVHRVSGVRV